jgi:hypothetical protein
MILLFFVNASLLRAQSLEIAPMAGYTLRSTFRVIDYEARILGAFNVGGIATYNLSPYYGLELSYINQQTEASTRSLFLRNADVPVTVHHIMVGGIKQFPISNSFIPYTGVNVGAAGFVPSDDQYDSGWRFAVGLKVGTKLMFTERLGVRLQAMAHMPINGLGTTLFLRPSGSSVGVSAYGALIQVGFMGGVVIRLF